MARSPLAPSSSSSMSGRPVPKPLPTPGGADTGVQALIEEIEQEVKAKQFADFLKRHGKAVGGALLAVILGTAVASTWNNIQIANQADDTGKLVALMDRDPDALSGDELKAVLKGYVELGEKGAGEGQRMIARLAEAGVLLRKGETDAAVERLKAMQADTSLRPLYRDYALLMEVRARMDKDKPDVLQAALKPLLDPKNGWYLSALETSAILFAKDGQKTDAVAQLQGILNTEDAPLSAKERASQLLRLYNAP